ncbi:hypothetical protein HK100_011995 [Physocladia obscura]|uniref:Uncharacterized protein n=1 Tax=Physocladia obscura TaxID=109957 RepID=A0AAD5XCU3_9FUNG|nr:hypothetical protein HK100_011995 [Physocladia obscura]
MPATRLLQLSLYNIEVVFLGFSSTCFCGPPKSTHLYLSEPVPVSISHDPESNKISVTPCAAKIPLDKLCNNGVTKVFECFQASRVHPDRLIYCLAGILFIYSSPNPFGGPKSNPGYWVYEGTTAADLINFIISSAYKTYFGWKGRFGLDAVVLNANYVLGLHNETGSDKRLADELVLRGMNRSNHREFRRATMIPPNLGFLGVPDEAEDLNAVYFTMQDIRSKFKLD